jgi:hypothetical protein
MAEVELAKYQASQASNDLHEGWRYFIEKTDLKAGTDPAAATEYRQSELEKRESGASGESAGESKDQVLPPSSRRQTE